MNMLKLTSKSDIIGSIASSLCLIHCLATPFIFLVQAQLVLSKETHPWWWGLLDLAFLVISLFAVYWSAKTTTRKWMSFVLWIFWLILAFVVINEKLSIIHLTETLIYIPTLGLFFIHLYNRNYCQCANEGCCVEK